MRACLALFVLSGCIFHAPPGATGDDDMPLVDASGDAALGDDALPLVCPTTASWQAIASSMSKYKIVSNSDEVVSWWNAEQRCEAEGAGIHLVVLESNQEAGDLSALYTTTKIYYIGFVQPNGAGLTSDGWRPLVAGPTISYWAPTEPNDGGGPTKTLDTGIEQFGVADQTGRLRDEDGHHAHNYICECDGKPLDPTLNIPQP
jgi:hypothetical protein